MNRFAKSLFTGINAVVLALVFLDPGFFLVFLVLSIVEFFGVLFMLIDKASRRTTGGIITAAGLSFLIGFSLCSSLVWIH